MFASNSLAVRRATQVAVAASTIALLGTGAALACSTPVKTPAPVVHHHCAPAPTPKPKPTCPPKPVVTPKPIPTHTPCPPKQTPTPTPKPVVTPTPTPVPSVTPTPAPQVLSAATQTSLPDTGSDFGGTAVGLGSMISAGVAYIRARKQK
jgi:LPXTG-motif cell wall-anchored protein